MSSCIFKFDGLERYLLWNLGTPFPQLKLTLKLQPLLAEKMMEFGNFAHESFGLVFHFCWRFAAVSAWTPIRDNCTKTNFETFSFLNQCAPHSLVRLQDNHSRKPAWRWIFMWQRKGWWIRILFLLLGSQWPPGWHYIHVQPWGSLSTATRCWISDESVVTSWATHLKNMSCVGNHLFRWKMLSWELCNLLIWWESHRLCFFSAKITCQKRPKTRDLMFVFLALIPQQLHVTFEYF